MLQLPLLEVWALEEVKQWFSLSCNLAKPSCIRGENAGYETSWFSPLTRKSIYLADIYLLRLLFLISVNILSGWPIINIFVCYQDMKLLWSGPMTYNPHTRFYYSKLFTYFPYDYDSFSNISGIDLCGNDYRQVLNWHRR
jgi:hypothetical protein